MDRNSLKSYIIVFISVFLISFLTVLLTGSLDRHYYGPISFLETTKEIPAILFFTIFCVIVFYIFSKERKK
jgi:hypothetical protein